jgi:hypothetical protein
MFTGTVSTCDANFFDMGGAGGTNATNTDLILPTGNYSDDQDQTLTITPANANSAVQVTFNNFRLENTYDFDNNQPTYLATDDITIGSVDGLDGAVCNIKYYTSVQTKSQIANSYNLLMNKNPPTNNL